VTVSLRVHVFVGIGSGEAAPACATVPHSELEYAYADPPAGKFGLDVDGTGDELWLEHAAKAADATSTTQGILRRLLLTDAAFRLPSRAFRPRRVRGGV